MKRKIVVPGLVGMLVSCITDRPTPLESERPFAFSAELTNGSVPVPAAGIGGAYTMTAGGIKVTDLELAPTGLQIPEGVPVRVVVTGHIDRKATDGLKQFCNLEFFRPLCDTRWKEIVAETPIPPSGTTFDWSRRGRARVAWNGGGGVVPAVGSGLVLQGPAQGEVWAGRDRFECYYHDDTEGTDIQGHCHDYSGGFTVIVLPEDGSPDPGSGGGGGGGGDSTGTGSRATLRVVAEPSSLGPGGGTVTARVMVDSGLNAIGVRWWFVPDSVTTRQGDSVPPPAAAAGAFVAAGVESADAPDDTLRARRVDAGSSSAAIPAPRAGPAVFHTVGTAAMASESQCDGDTTCTFFIPRSGSILIAATVSGRAMSAAARVTVGEQQSVRIADVVVKGPNPEGSFTTAPGENRIELEASVEPPTAADSLVWVVAANPDAAAVTKPPAAAPRRVPASFLAPRPDNPTTRWPTSHPGALEEKALGYEVQAEARLAGSVTQSAKARVRQDEIDTIREEYIEFGRSPVPGRGAFGRPRSEHFGPPADELNSGDYLVYWLEPVALERLEVLRLFVEGNYEQYGLAFSGITVTGGYRNPVHHRIHLGLTNDSNHQYGLAFDLRIDRQALSSERFFELLRVLSRSEPVGACFEPEAVLRAADRGQLTHAHVEWPTTCTEGW